MKRVGLSRFRLAPGARSTAPATPVRPSVLEPQGFRVPPKEKHPAPAAPSALPKTAGPIPAR
jgi:hypothetical protein